MPCHAMPCHANVNANAMPIPNRRLPSSSSLVPSIGSFVSASNFHGLHYCRIFGRSSALPCAVARTPAQDECRKCTRQRRTPGYPLHRDVRISALHISIYIVGATGYVVVFWKTLRRRLFTTDCRWCDRLWVIIAGAHVTAQRC